MTAIRTSFQVRTLFALFVLACLASGCVERDDSTRVRAENAQQQTGDEADPHVTDQTLQEPQNLFQVTLLDYEIIIPDELPAGVVLLEVSNEGDREHSFMMEGNGREVGIESPIPPGTTSRVRAELQPGLYRAYCPVENHAERGMQTEVRVSEAEG